MRASNYVYNCRNNNIAALIHNINNAKFTETDFEVRAPRTVHTASSEFIARYCS